MRTSKNKKPKLARKEKISKGRVNRMREIPEAKIANSSFFALKSLKLNDAAKRIARGIAKEIVLGI